MSSNNNRNRNPRMEVTGIVVHFKNGQYVNIDTRKVMLVDKNTKEPLFQEVLEPIPQQIGEEAPASQPDGESTSRIVETDQGSVEVVQNGNWTGVRPVKNKEKKQ
jgi:hypothetical protein